MSRWPTLSLKGQRLREVVGDEQADLEIKRRHVRGSYQDREHVCHWPKCLKPVPPAYWGCRKHWFMLPKALRDKVWAMYRVGQEQRMDPSPEYLAVAKEVQEWIRSNSG